MKILVCGSRSLWMDALLTDRIRRYLEEKWVTEVIHGGARGADTHAEVAAKQLGLPTTVFQPDWSAYGRLAGFRRNQRMLDEGKPNFVVAFWDGKSRGTTDMVRRAQEAGIPTEVIRMDQQTEVAT